MAKKTVSRKPAAPAVRDSAGWGVWLAAFAILCVPSWFLSYRITVDYEKDGVAPWATAFVLAAVGAGLVSVAMNYALRARATAIKKRAAAQRKK